MAATDVDIFSVSTLIQFSAYQRIAICIYVREFAIIRGSVGYVDLTVVSRDGGSDFSQ
jgi:hypothetical protein